MIDAVFIFGFINILFELVVISMIPVRFRLRLLGSNNQQLFLHCFILLLVITIHWGTLVGTMSGFLSFILSMATVRAAQALYGKLEGGRYYTLGLIKYSPSELK
jgi:hypothetical protein